MAIFIDTLLFLLCAAAFLAGLFFCSCAGYLLERDKGADPLYVRIISIALFIVSGGAMVGGAGYKLQFVLQINAWNEQPHTTYTMQAILVSSAIACADFGMRAALKANRRPTG